MDSLNEKDMNIGLVVMASGLGKRFGANKLIEIVDGKPLIKWILDSTDNLFAHRIVVTRHKEVKELCDKYNINCILHNCPNRNDTVRLGLSELANDIDYCFFALGDQPLLKRDSIMKLIAEAKRHNCMITRAGFGDMVGSPVGFPNIFFDELMKLPEGKGGNYIVQKNQELVSVVEVMNEYELWDVDTVSDLDRIKAILKSI